MESLICDLWRFFVLMGLYEGSTAAALSWLGEEDASLEVLARWIAGSYCMMG